MGSKEDGSCLHSGNDAAIRRRGTAGNIIGDRGGRGRMFFFGQMRSGRLGTLVLGSLGKF